MGHENPGHDQPPGHQLVDEIRYPLTYEAVFYDEKGTRTELRTFDLFAMLQERYNRSGYPRTDEEILSECQRVSAVGHREPVDRDSLPVPGLAYSMINYCARILDPLLKLVEDEQYDLPSHGERLFARLGRIARSTSSS